MSTMKSYQKVYCGPSSSTYATAGSVNKDEEITVKWSENGWYYIEYFTSSKKKRGYVPTSTVNLTGTVSAIPAVNAGVRYLQKDLTVYYGAAPSISTFETVGSVSYGERVQYLGVKENNNAYAFIEYTITNSTQKKRGWIDTMKLGTVRVIPTLNVGSYPSDMNINGPDYTTNNWYVKSDPDLKGECTWFCWGRAQEKCAKYISFNIDGNDGGEWYDHCDAAASGVTKRAASLGPVTNSICSCSGPTYHGHVIFVELVDGNTVYYTEANTKGADGVVKSCAKANFPPDGRTAYGYLVMD